MKNPDQPIPEVLRNLKGKYYKTFVKRISAKSGHLLKIESDRKLIARLQAELERLSFKFRAIFDNSNSYYIILDRQLSILDYNKASLHFIKKLFNKRLKIGDSILGFLHPSSIKMVTENCEKSFNGEKYAVEKRIRHQDNLITWWCFEFSPAFDLKGHVTGAVLIANDITKRKAFEEKIRSQHKKLMDICVMQSHEVRGPVSTIMGLMSLIKDSNYEPEREYLMLLELTADQLDKNIREIVDLASDNLRV